jgi:hypothetical protein
MVSVLFRVPYNTGAEPNQKNWQVPNVSALQMHALRFFKIINNNNKIIYLLDVFQSKKPSMESLEKDLKLLSEVSY